LDCVRVSAAFTFCATRVLNHAVPHRHQYVTYVGQNKSSWNHLRTLARRTPHPLSPRR
jgi:hypothetical protein